MSDIYELRETLPPYLREKPTWEREAEERTRERKREFVIRYRAELEAFIRLWRSFNDDYWVCSCGEEVRVHCAKLSEALECYLFPHAEKHGIVKGLSHALYDKSVDYPTRYDNRKFLVAFLSWWIKWSSGQEGVFDNWYGFRTNYRIKKSR